MLPLVPLYLSYLAGGLNVAAEAGSAQGQMSVTEEKRGERRKRLRLFLRVFCFTLGISGAFFVLGLGASAAGSFFREQRMLFARIGGILIVLFGLYQLGGWKFHTAGEGTSDSAAAGKDDHVAG